MTFRINFDYEIGKNNTSSAVTFPKIYQGAPYSLPFKIKDSSNNVYRDFSSIYEIKMQARTSMNSVDPLFTALKSQGHFSISPDGITVTITFPPELCSTITPDKKVGVASIVELPFVYSIEFLDTNGKVTEIFSNGTGFIVLNPTR